MGDVHNGEILKSPSRQWEGVRFQYLSLVLLGGSERGASFGPALSMESNTNLNRFHAYNLQIIESFKMLNIRCSIF